MKLSIIVPVFNEITVVKYVYKTIKTTHINYKSRTDNTNATTSLEMPDDGKLRSLILQPNVDISIDFQL